MPNIPVRISVVNAQGQPLGGAVDFIFTPVVATTTAPITVRGLDASRDIDVGAQQNIPRGQYQLTTRAADGTTVSQTVTIDGTTPIRVVVNPSIVIPKRTLQGTL